MKESVEGAMPYMVSGGKSILIKGFTYGISIIGPSLFREKEAHFCRPSAIIFGPQPKIPHTPHQFFHAFIALIPHTSQEHCLRMLAMRMRGYDGL